MEKSSAPLFVMQEWLGFSNIFFHSGPENNQHIPFGKMMFLFPPGGALN